MQQPETDTEFIASTKERIRAGLHAGVMLGWWDAVDEVRLEPIKYKRFTLADGPNMAHVMHKAGLFKSVSDARRNGWDRPIECGQWTVGKSKTVVIITEQS